MGSENIVRAPSRVTADGAQMTLPKSLRHWAERAGFHIPKGFHRSWRRHGHFWARSRKAEHTSGCRDRKRHIRVLSHIDRMDICDGYFDRWANSMGASVQIPRTEADFHAAIKSLLSKSRKRVAATHDERGSSASPSNTQGDGA